MLEFVVSLLSSQSLQQSLLREKLAPTEVVTALTMVGRSQRMSKCPVRSVSCDKWSVKGHYTRNCIRCYVNITSNEKRVRPENLIIIKLLGGKEVKIFLHLALLSYRGSFN